MVLKPVVRLAGLGKLIFSIVLVHELPLLVGQEARSSVKRTQAIRVLNTHRLGPQQEILHAQLNLLFDAEHGILGRTVLVRLRHKRTRLLGELGPVTARKSRLVFQHVGHASGSHEALALADFTLR